jgi:hypothetical protein
MLPTHSAVASMAMTMAQVKAIPKEAQETSVNMFRIPP